MSEGVTRGKVIICTDLEHFCLLKNEFAWLYRISSAAFESGTGT